MLSQGIPYLNKGLDKKGTISPSRSLCHDILHHWVGLLQQQLSPYNRPLEWRDTKYITINDIKSCSMGVDRYD